MGRRHNYFVYPFAKWRFSVISFRIGQIYDLRRDYQKREPTTNWEHFARCIKVSCRSLLFPGWKKWLKFRCSNNIMSVSPMQTQLSASSSNAGYTAQSEYMYNTNKTQSAIDTVLFFLFLQHVYNDRKSRWSAEALLDLLRAQCTFLFEPKEVCVFVSCDRRLIVTRFQLDDVSVCCEVSVGLVQGCEWHQQCISLRRHHAVVFQTPV